MVKRKREQHKGKENDPSSLNEFEQARLRRIQQNKQVLADMGLENAAQQMSAETKQSRARQPKGKSCETAVQGDISQQLVPTRRSKRIAKEPAAEAEHIELGADESSRQVSHSGGRKPRAASSGKTLEQSDLDTHHNHNLHRIRTMSEKALIRRAWKITNIGKLKSFVEVLEAAGDLESVLQEAKAALADLTGQSQ